MKGILICLTSCHTYGTHAEVRTQIKNILKLVIKIIKITLHMEKLVKVFSVQF